MKASLGQPNYVWQKFATVEWLQRHQPSLDVIAKGAHVVIERPNRKRLLVEVCCGIGTGRRLLKSHGGTVKRLPANWKSAFLTPSRGKRINVGKRLSIVGAAEAHVDGKRRVLIIPAEAAFGTGEHVTTAMSLRLLERITRPLPVGWTMLDAGTGSGILAIAGSYFGARRALAIDRDPLACATAKRNARVNRIGNIEFKTSDVLKQKLCGKFEIITANLLSEILIEALPIWSRHLAADAHLILSGILRSQETALLRALRQHSFIPSEIRRRGKWIACLVGRDLRARRLSRFSRTARRAVPT